MGTLMPQLTLFLFGGHALDDAGGPLFSTQAKGKSERKTNRTETNLKRCGDKLGTYLQLLQRNEEHKYQHGVFRKSTDS